MNVIRKKAVHGMNYSRCSISHYKRFGKLVFVLFALSLFILYFSAVYSHHSPLAFTIFGLAHWLTHNGRFSGVFSLFFFLYVVDNLHTCFMCVFVLQRR